MIVNFIYKVFIKLISNEQERNLGYKEEINNYIYIIYVFISLNYIYFI